jgi:hypothetical protein
LPNTNRCPSRKAIEYIVNAKKTSKSKDMQYQAVESRLSSNGENANALQLKRFYVVTIDKETGVEGPPDQSNSYTDRSLYVYTEKPPAMNSSNLYMYSIISKNTNTTLGIVFLKQESVNVKRGKYPDHEYHAKLLYMDASSLGRSYGNHSEAVHLAKRYERIFGEHTFTKFKTGELFERPFQLFNQPLTCVSVHEPLARPPILSVIVQDPVDPRVSVVVCKATQAINSHVGALEIEGNPSCQCRYVIYAAIVVIK